MRPGDAPQRAWMMPTEKGRRNEAVRLSLRMFPIDPDVSWTGERETESHQTESQP